MKSEVDSGTRACAPGPVDNTRDHRFRASGAGEKPALRRRNDDQEFARERRTEWIIGWLPLVRMIAASEFQRLGTLTRLLQIEFEDLFQTGVIGLITASDRFDPRMGAPKAYLARRIRGAMLDFLRSFPYFKNGEAVERTDESELSSVPVPCRELKGAEMRADLERLAASLNVSQRAVILGIAHETPQYLVARALGVNQSRVSQIKNESLAALRSACALEFRAHGSA